jgi:hypothetical protein
MIARTARLVALLLVALVAIDAGAREVRVPLQLDTAFLLQQLREQVYRDPDATARVADASGCNDLVLSAPAISLAETRLRVETAVDGEVGVPVLGWCMLASPWSGEVAALEEPFLDPARAAIHFRVVDSSVADRGSQGWLPIGRLWGWVKPLVHPRLELLTLDLGTPVEELAGLLPLFLPSAEAERGRSLLESLAIAEVAVAEPGVRVTLRLEVAPAPVPEAGEPEPALDEAELAAFAQALDHWDGFVTFVLKHAATDTTDAALRAELLDVLLRARHELVRAAARPDPRAPDAVRPLFIRTWGRLAPLLRRLHTGLPGDLALRYLTFIAAGDALRAIDELGPGSGLDVSDEGLRRFARLIAPESAEDPLAHGPLVDPDLRRAFGFGPPLPEPAEEAPAPEATPPAPPPAPPGSLRPPLDVENLLGWLVPVAYAAGTPGPGDRTAELRKRLDRWIPAAAELLPYLSAVRELLRRTGDRILERKDGLPERFHPLYRNLLLATAWQESCWRHWVLRDGRPVPLRSGVGAVGLMQVHPRVWRGFYDVPGLESDIAYNGLAGGEILLHYLRDYAIARGEEAATGDPDSLARAAYAAYNGGPSHLRRYRRPGTRRSLRAIDESFLAKYLEVKRGHELAVAACYGAATPS